MPKSVPPRYFEDFTPGMVIEFGDYVMRKEEIIEFARAYDPQPFHLGEELADGSGSNRLIASGWHTGSATMRMMVDNFIPSETIFPSPGLNELKFVRPVVPGDRLRVKMIVVSVRRSATKLDRGIVTFSLETLNQRNEVVLSYISPIFFRVRSAEVR